jgi:hypothetical protein
MRIAPEWTSIAREVFVRVFLLLWLIAVPGVVSAGSASPATTTDPVAVVASAKGRVDVASARGGAAVPVAFGRPLERGDKVTVGPGGAATLFFSDGNVIALAERSSITIGGRLAAAQHGSALPGDVFTHVSHFATAGSRQTGLVAMAEMRSDVDAGAPLLLAPRNTSLLDDAPTLRWRAVSGATRYRVHIGPSGGAELWTREVPAGADAEPSLAYPADAARLSAGVDYQWEVEALDDKGTLRREGTTVRVLPGEARASVRGNLARIGESAGGDQSAASHFLAGSYLSGLGLFEDAARQFQDLARLAPESPGPHEALGNLYLNIGLSDRAAAEFQQALALQRDAH